jgi:hypothetical protein
MTLIIIIIIVIIIIIIIILTLNFPGILSNYKMLKLLGCLTS